MFNEILNRARNPDLQSAITQAQGVLATPTPAAEPKGIRGFFRQAQQPGGFFERLGTFGAQLQDIDDGGNRMAQREALTLRQQEAALKTREADDQARVRQQIDAMAKELNLSGSDRLRFAVDPEGYLKDRWQAEQPDDPVVLNTREGVYRYQDGQGEFLQRFEPESPDAPTGYRFGPDGNLEFIPGGPADPRQAGGLAASRRAPARTPASRGGGRASAPRAATASAPPWKRTW